MHTRVLISAILLSALILPGVAQAASTAQRPRPEDKPGRQGPATKKSTTRAATSYKNLRYPPINNISIPEPARFELHNGMIVYLVEDHELPLINLSVMIRIGSRWEPVNKAGLAAITGTVMRTGGTPGRSGDALDQELDRLGAVVETSIGESGGDATVSVLKEDIDTGLSILADLLQHPAFPEDKIELAKIEQRDSVARRNDDPSSISFREFGRILYGKDSAYGHQPEYETLKSVSRADLVAFHRQFIQPESVILGAWGDFRTGEMRGKIEKAFGGWARGGQPRPVPPEVDRAAQSRAGLYLINKEDVNQSRVLMGLLGGKRSDPDYYALSVVNTVLGGGFASRLFSNVRSEQGLAYEVFSTWNAEWDRPGSFLAVGSTKSETTTKIIGSMKREIERLAETEVGETELASAKDRILKGFAFEFDSTGKIVQRLMTYEYYGYPRDYLQRYRENIEKVTRADVMRVARQYLKTNQFIVLVLGKEKDFDKPLSSLGRVTAVDITISQPKEQPLGAATPESIARGKKLLSGVLEAMGGDTVRAVKDYTTTSTLNLATPQGEFAVKVESTVRVSGMAFSKMNTPVGEMVQGFDGQIAWIKTPQGARELPQSQREEAEALLFRDTFRLLQGIEDPALTVQALGLAEVAGKQFETVTVFDKSRNRQVKLFIDPTTNLLLKKEYVAALMGAPGKVEEIYSEYRDIGGIRMPYRILLNQNGKKIGEQSIIDVKLNPGIVDGAFKRP